MAPNPLPPTGRPRTRLARLSRWLVTPGGQRALAIGLFALAEMFSLPILIVALVIVPMTDGRPMSSASPAMFWTLLGATLAIPALCSLVFYLRVRQSLGTRRPRP